jgi:hypothetical protein
MQLPYRDELAAASARIELLERAANHGVCESCAARASRRRQRPLTRVLTGVALALLMLTVGVVTGTSLLAELRCTGRACRRSVAMDM